MKTFLFQGDSITDAGRDFGNDARRGYGYPVMVSGELMLRYPGEMVCINKGVSGNRSVDVLARIKRDILNYKPDYMTLLIGVNDVWHELGEKPNGINAEDFEDYLDMLIGKVLKALPEIKIFMLEPFILPGRATDENWEYFSTEVPKRAAAVKCIAEKYSLPFIPLQEKFDKACGLAPADWWLEDGVHPAVAGHALIAKEILKFFD